MPNKTIYVSDTDISLFDEAKQIAGEALSSVIVRALKEYVSRHREMGRGMKEIAVKVGIPGGRREQRFVGIGVGKWQGFSNNKVWFLKADIFKTQKGNWVVSLETICKASLLINKKDWKESGDYLTNPQKSELFVGKSPGELMKILPKQLYESLVAYAKQYENPVEFLDI